MALTEAICKNIRKHPKATEGKMFTIFDEQGLYLLVKPAKTGFSQWWRLKYRHDGKDKLISLGTYPHVDLAKARQRRDAAKRLLADGIDPQEHQKAEAEAKTAQINDTFENIAREFGQRNIRDWEHKNNRIKRRLELYLFPWLGSKPISDIKPKDSCDFRPCHNTLSLGQSRHVTKPRLGHQRTE